MSKNEPERLRVLKPAPPLKAPRRLQVAMPSKTQKTGVPAGREAERAALASLEGWTILEQNYRCRQGEVDIIARDGDTLVFIEVKARSHGVCGSPGEALTALKMSRIRRAGLTYLAKSAYTGSVRFDVILRAQDDLPLEHIRDAFSA